MVDLNERWNRDPVDANRSFRGPRWLESQIELIDSVSEPHCPHASDRCVVQCGVQVTGDNNWTLPLVALAELRR